MRGRLLVLIAAGGLLVGALALVGSVLLGAKRPPAHALTRAPAEIGMLEQTLVEHSERGLALRKSQRQKLERYRYVDRSSGLVEIPIERAMDLELEERR